MLVRLHRFYFSASIDLNISSAIGFILLYNNMLGLPGFCSSILQAPPGFYSSMSVIFGFHFSLVKVLVLVLVICFVRKSYM